MSDTFCNKCGSHYDLREGSEPSPFCDECAQAALIDLQNAVIDLCGVIDGVSQVEQLANTKSLIEDLQRRFDLCKATGDYLRGQVKELTDELNLHKETRDVRLEGLRDSAKAWEEAYEVLKRTT